MTEHRTSEQRLPKPMRYKIQQNKGKYCLKGCADGDLVDTSSYLRLAYAAKTMAVMALQSARYSTDGEFQQAVDDVLHLTEGVRL